MKHEPSFQLEKSTTVELWGDRGSSIVGQQAGGDIAATGAGKAPRTARGERTLRKILDAALAEFGERGFAESSIVVDHQPGRRRARDLLHLLRQQGGAVPGARPRHVGAGPRPRRACVGGRGDAIDAERRALKAFLEFVIENKEVYRIIDEAEFVDPDGFRQHYETTAARIAARLGDARQRGELRKDESPRPTRSSPGR